MHPVVDSLGPSLIASGHAGLQVHHARSRRHAVQFFERVPPDIGIADLARDGPIDRLGERHVCSRVSYDGFLDRREARMAQNLIDAPARHDVAGQEDA